MKKQLKLSATVILAGGGLFFATAAPANALTCADGTLTSLLNNSCTTSQGFTFKLTAFSNFAGTDQFTFTNGGTNNFQYSLQGASAYTVAGSNYSLSYDLTAPSGRLLSLFTASGSSSVEGAQADYTLTESAQSKTAVASIGFPATTGGSATFSPKITTTTFTGTLDVNVDNISSVTGLVTSVLPAPAPASGVPGPLPILGAGCAFGFSRKVRNRIKSVA
jgi:hypothetical protein